MIYEQPLDPWINDANTVFVVDPATIRGFRIVAADA